MPVRAGQIVIDITAGTSKFVVDIENAKGKIREFGAQAGGSMRQANAEIRALEGNFANNNRAAASFFTTVLGGANIVKAAFPVVGALAFAGVIDTVGTKAYNFFKGMQEAPEKIAGAFRSLTGPLQLTNDELAVSNARLENEIAKLEGHRENMLKLALLEAKEAADKLADSLQKDLEGIEKILKENDIGWKQKLFGKAGIDDIKAEIGGSTGRGGFLAQVGAEKDPEKLTALYAEEIKKLQGWLFASQRAQRGGGTLTGRNEAPSGDQTARIETLHDVIRNLQAEMERVTLETEHGSLSGRKDQLAAISEQAKKDQEEINRLNEALARAKAEQLQGLQRIDAEEQGEIERLSRAHELNSSTLALVREIYDIKRITVFNAELEKYNNLVAESNALWQKNAMEAHKALDESWKKDIEDGQKALERLDKTAEELSKHYNELNAETDNRNLSHRVRMIGLNNASADPLAVLSAQQDIERADIMERYNEALKHAILPLQTAIAIREKDLALLRLQQQMEEAIAQQRQKGVRDFFLEMQRQAQTASNIMYEAMHSALDRVSDQFANLLTGQKTSFGKMFEDIGHQMVQSSIKSAMQRGLGALGKAIGIHPPAGKPDGTTGNPYHVVIDKGSAGEGGDAATDKAKSALGGLGNLGGIFKSAFQGIGSFIGKLFGHGGGESVTSSISFMAEGGDVYPGNTYGVAEAGEFEIFQPKGPGTITPAHKIGGNHYEYHVDARGAELGVEGRVSAAIQQAHSESIRDSVHASAERAKRSPQRSHS